MRVTFMKEMTVFWSSTMAIKLLAVLSVLATVNGWQYDGGDNGSSASLPEGEVCRIKTGEPGLCKRLTSCVVYYEALRQKTIRYSFLVRCSFIDTEEVICCPSDDTSINTGSTTEQTSIGWGKLIGTTKATTTTTTTTMEPIVVGDKTLTGNEPFFDLSKILKSTTTKRPRQSRFDPPSPSNNNRRPNEGIFNPAAQNPWIGSGNNNQWTGQQMPQTTQINTPPFGQQSNVRFPTEPSRWKQPQRMPIDPDVEVFNTIDNNRDASANMVQFPGQVLLQPITTNFPPKTETFVDQNDIFEPFKFRPGSDDSNVRPKNNDNWDWSTQNTERTVRTTTRRTTTTTTTETSGLTNWMIDALNQATTTTTSTPSPPVTAIPFATTPTPTRSSTIESVTTRENGSERPAQAACRRYSGANPAGLTFHILDGVPVAPGEYPHMGGLIYPVGGGADVDNRCGSSLISERYVLTAAHCVNDPLSLPRFVRFGVVVWNSTDDSILPVDVEIENITLHPDYLSHLRYHDVALIRLRNEVEFTPFIRPACLYSDMKDIETGTVLVVIGWGVTNVQTRARSQVLLMTNVTTVALQDCNATHIAYGTSRSYRTGLNEGHYCAFDPELKKDACQSDSGGPLQLVQNKESSIVGIVSFGLSCGSSVPSVYARVAYYLDWIESIVWPS